MFSLKRNNYCKEEIKRWYREEKESHNKFKGGRYWIIHETLTINAPLIDSLIIVKPKDAKALSKAMKKLLNDKEMGGNFSLHCRNRALQNYTIKKFRDSYIEIYKKILWGIKK